MKFLIIFFSFLLLSCNKEKSQNLISNETVKSNNATEDNEPPSFDENKYEFIYHYLNEDSFQIIGLSFLGDDKIDFHLKTNTLPCDTQYWGEAINSSSSNDHEIDEDEELEAYPVREFIKENEEEILIIRIALDKSKIQIKHQRKDELETDCLPILNKVMIRK
jgi:hypothetical protein